MTQRTYHILLTPEEESRFVSVSDAEAEELLQVRRDFLAGRTKARSWEEVKNALRNQNTQRSGHN